MEKAFNTIADAIAKTLKKGTKGQAGIPGTGATIKKKAFKFPRFKAGKPFKDGVS